MNSEFITARILEDGALLLELNYGGTFPPPECQENTCRHRCPRGRWACPEPEFSCLLDRGTTGYYPDLNCGPALSKYGSVTIRFSLIHTIPVPCGAPKALSVDQTHRPVNSGPFGSCWGALEI